MRPITHDQILANLEELKELAQPLVDYLKKRYDPMCTIVIAYDFVKVVSEEMGIPYPIDD